MKQGVTHPKHAVLLLGIADVVLQQQAVHLAVHIFYGYLKAIEGARLRQLDLCTMATPNS